MGSKKAPARSVLAASRKRKYNANELGDLEQHPPRKTQPTSKRTSTKPGAVSVGKGRRVGSSQGVAPLPVINQVPTEILTIIVFGNGDNGELGLGPKQTEALRPRPNPYLDPNDPSKFHIVQLACGGMHTIALTADNKIVTWGVNDNSALGRDTRWDEKMRDMDAESDDEDGELNPLESKPTEIPADHFPPGTQFVQVAAGDSCSFALTDTGLVYGWGTFRVCFDLPCVFILVLTLVYRTLKVMSSLDMTTMENLLRSKICLFLFEEFRKLPKLLAASTMC